MKMEILSKNLLSIRKAVGLTQVDMSAGLGIKRTTYSTYEIGSHAPTIFFGIEVEQRFGVSPRDLCTVNLSDDPGFQQKVSTAYNKYLLKLFQASPIQISDPK